MNHLLDECMTINHSQYSYDVLDAIYHSNNASEMQVKSDMLLVDLNDVNVIIFLIDTTTYHKAFWPHTSKRFAAFKNLLRHNKQLKIEDIDMLLLHVNDKIDKIRRNKWKNSIPGGKKEIINLQQIQKILYKLLKNKALS